MVSVVAVNCTTTAAAAAAAAVGSWRISEDDFFNRSSSSTIAWISETFQYRLSFCSNESTPNHWTETQMRTLVAPGRPARAATAAEDDDDEADVVRCCRSAMLVRRRPSSSLPPPNYIRGWSIDARTRMWCRDVARIWTRSDARWRHGLPSFSRVARQRLTTWPSGRWSHLAVSGPCNCQMSPCPFGRWRRRRCWCCCCSFTRWFARVTRNTPERLTDRTWCDYKSTIRVIVDDNGRILFNEWV